ncbi:MAG: hypothetical protein WC974_04870 [Thermoplasmata archaeon]
MRNLKNKNGVAGFFEDIPALIVVTIGVGIFLTSIVTIYPKYIESEQNTDFMRESFNVAETIRASDDILYEPDMQNGVFDAYKVQKMDSQQLNQTVHTELRCRIDIIDASDYPTKYNKTTQNFEDSEVPNFRMRYSITLPVCIKKSEAEVHPAKMIVTLYKM